MGEAICGFLAFVSYAITLTSATVFINPLHASFPDLPAKYAVAISSSGVCGALHVADPPDACSALKFGVRSNETEETRLALIIRGGCTFEGKVRNAQNAGFRAAIVYDDRNKGNLVYMMINPGNITVHAVFVSKATGEILNKYAQREKGECCIFSSHYESAWTVLTISLISFTVICAIVLLVFYTPRRLLFAQTMYLRSKSVDTETVEALPCFTFGSAHPRHCHTNETCAICLEDYKDGEILKVLPCRHEFHSSCVNSWLTKSGTFCPVCKHDLGTKSAHSEVNKGI
ncbi:hypothetical protein I3842_07G062000 [Carya illinoinensis]|uniref:RING-type domain-containing protein n=1 Tax=Carya illinoinensis TaxID=32201 RepID=A0A922EHD3_CARIL|nr:hypothetical protein I3842_07G062000 [Carya illinoinensis]